MKQRTMVKSRIKSRQLEVASTKTKVSTGALATVGTASALAGLWSVACLVGGMISAGGPVALAQAWFTAVGGM